MDEKVDTYYVSTTAGGVTAEHPPKPAIPPSRVAPSTLAGHNRLKHPLIPEACWSLGDVRFEFGSSFIKPEVAEDISSLAGLIDRLEKRHGRRPVLTIFGHADPVGQGREGDISNRKLSERRAAVVYAMLTRNVSIWEDIYTNARNSAFVSRLEYDWWGLKTLQSILKDLALDPQDPNPEYDPGPIDGLSGSRTRAAVKAFQRDHGLAVDGDPGPKTRAELFMAYMNKHSTLRAAESANGGRSEPFKLEKSDFLAHGADPACAGDYQGCGEFNPLLLFSKQEEEEFGKPENKTERDLANAPNRRVVVYLFLPGTRVDPGQWPCRRAKDGVAPCAKRFWGGEFDGDKRRNLRLDKQRKYQETHDTFACRLYDRFAHDSPCERLTEGGMKLVFYDEAQSKRLPFYLFLVYSGDEHILTAESDCNGEYVLDAALAGDVWIEVIGPGPSHPVWKEEPPQEAEPDQPVETPPEEEPVPDDQDELTEPPASAGSDADAAEQV